MTGRAAAIASGRTGRIPSTTMHHPGYALPRDSRRPISPRLTQITRCLLPALWVAAFVACTEPGTLVISLGRVPAATAETELAISGNVSRVPAKETEIVLTSSGGAS
ncbi:MAG: hypothetical protein PVF27_08520, partial [Gemmatimonadales bacterium]